MSKLRKPRWRIMRNRKNCLEYYNSNTKSELVKKQLRSTLRLITNTFAGYFWAQYVFTWKNVYKKRVSCLLTEALRVKRLLNHWQARVFSKFFVCKWQAFDNIRTELKAYTTNSGAYDIRHKASILAFCDLGKSLAGQNKEYFFNNFCEMLVDESLMGK